MDENNNDFNARLKSFIGTGVKSVGKQIALAFLPIIPYLLLIFCSLIIVFILIFAAMDLYTTFMDEAVSDINTVGDKIDVLAEKVGNLASLHGFKTNYDVEKSEEARFIYTLTKYSEKYGFDDYQISLIVQTLLYEGNLEEEIYLSEVSSYSNCSNINCNFFDEMKAAINGTFFNNSSLMARFNSTYNVLTALKNPLGTLTGLFAKVVYNRFSSNFLGSFYGMSQYEKANKDLYRVAVITDKCKSLTGGENYDFDKFNTCYRGYLVANNDLQTMWYVLTKQIESPVKSGYLVSMNVFSEAEDNGLKLFESLTRPLVLPSLFFEFLNNIRFAIDVKLTYWLAGDSTKYFLYDGYEVQNLKEYYKVRNYDSEEEESQEKLNNMNIGILSIFDMISKSAYVEQLSQTIQDLILDNFIFLEPDQVEKEIKNREILADDIFDRTQTYFEAKYGTNYFNKNKNKNSSVIIKKKENNASVSVMINGSKVDVSFDDYVKLILIDEYGTDILKSENDEFLKSLIVKARTKAYERLGKNLNTVNADNSDFSDAYEKYHDSVSSSDNSRLDKLIKDTAGLVVKDSNGNINGNVNIENPSDDSDATMEDIIGNTGNQLDSVSDIVSPIPSINNLYNYLSSGYNSIDSAHITEHGGVDIAIGAGTDVTSVVEGEVIASYNQCGWGSLDSRCGPSGYGGYGNVVVIKSYDSNNTPYYTYYAHMTGGSVTVNVGDTVVAGQVIGKVGSSGSSTGAHLHFEVRYGSNDKISRVNPLEFYGF